MIKHYSLLLFLIITLNFFIPRLMPGDALTFFMIEANESGVNVSDEQLKIYKNFYGFDKNIFEQFINYIINLAKGDLGYSFHYKSDVLSLLLAKMPWTIFIVTTSMILSVVLGSFLACISVWYKKIDKFMYSVLIVLSEIPAFFIGTMLLIFFAVKLNLFPLFGGAKSFYEHQNTMEFILDVLYHGILPITTLAIVGACEFYLLARNSMLTIISKDYIRTAKAKALNKKRIFFRYFLQNSFYPVLSSFAIKIGKLFGGAILVESVFSYPGVGDMIYHAIALRDYALVQGIFLVISIIILSLNLLVEIIHKKLDPRVSR